MDLDGGLAEEVGADSLTWDAELPSPPALRTVTFVLSSNETGKPVESSVDSLMLLSTES